MGVVDSCGVATLNSCAVSTTIPRCLAEECGARGVFHHPGESAITTLMRTGGEQ